MGRSLLQGIINGTAVSEGQMTLVSNLLQYGTSATTTSTAPLSTNGIMQATLQQDKLHHLLGLSGCNNTQAAWRSNNSAWFQLVKCTTASTKQEFIKTHFCVPLQAAYGQDMDFTKHQGFIKILETFSFAPVLDVDPPKVTHGLSPLCFFELHKGALISANYYDALNRQASVNTTSDIEKAKLGQLIMP